MLPLFRNDKQPAKIQIAHGGLTRYIDPAEPPTKRKPFSSLWAQHHSHTLELIFPAELAEIVQRHFDDSIGNSHYAKVNLSLIDILSGDFFDTYIKAGNVSMLCEGVNGVDETFELHDGVLTLEVNRPEYERCGLVGKPIHDGGRKHTKSRFRIEFNLREPHMLKGRKLFDRLLAAAKQVLSSHKTWLFFDHRATALDTAEAGPIKAFHPQWFPQKPSSMRVADVRVPRMPLLLGERSAYTADPDYAAELHEWLALVAMGSPRIHAGHTVDPYLCRYSLPDLGSAPGTDERTCDVVALRLQGLVPSAIAFQALLAVRKATLKVGRQKKTAGGQPDENEAMDVDVQSAPPADGKWAALMLHGFRDEHLAIFLPVSGAEYVEWAHQKRL